MAMPETIGGYRILGEIGSGGSGAVYRAYSPSTRRAVALKTLDPNRDAAVVTERFRREVLLTSEINHPNVIDILDEGEDGGVYFIVMEMMPLSLRDALSAGSLPISRAMDMCRQAALGLKAAHERGIIHRDVTPNNILLDSSGAVKVGDFGLARAEDLRSIAEYLRTVTVAGNPIGTPLYRSPEQWRSQHADVRSDIYSLGVVLHEMLTGKEQFLIVDGTPVKQIRPSVPTGLEQIVAKCTEREPSDRYQTMDELLQEITNPALINRCVLIDFYEAMGGPNWKRDDNWLTDAPLSEWYGLDGNEEIYGEYYDQDVYDSYDLFVGHYYDERRKRYERSGFPVNFPEYWQRPVANDLIVGINLEFNDIEGTIPPEIGYMAGLTYLGLNDNPGIVGPFPPELWGLVKLQGLNLSNTQLSGTLPPPDMGRLEGDPLYTGLEMYEDFALSCLNLSNCRFTGEMPWWLPVKRSFGPIRDDSASLYLSGNNWTGTGGMYNDLIKDSDKIPSLSSRDV